MLGQLVTVIALVAIVVLAIAAGAARRGDPRGRTLLRFVTRGALCLALAFLLFEVFFGPPIGCGPPLVRNRTTAIHRALISGLENHHSEFGEYPQPVRRGKTVVIDGHSYDVDSAIMLYQVMTGNGNDAIVMKNNDKASDGQFDNDGASRAMLTDVPKEMWKRTPVGYIIVDGHGHPFQYEACSADSADTVSQNYDLWSFGDVPPEKVAKLIKQDPKLTEKWIKNWQGFATHCCRDLARCAPQSP